MGGHVRLYVARLSHPVMGRTNNEDSVFVDGEHGLAVLADGMCGYSAGEVASGMAVNVISTGMLEELKSGRELSRVDISSGISWRILRAACSKSCLIIRSRLARPLMLACRRTSLYQVPASTS